MTPGTEPRDDDAIELDRSLDRLLAGRTGGPRSVAADPGRRVDPDLEYAARVVAGALSRFHPSFRFEERLAARLQDANPAQDVGASTSDSERGLLIPFEAPATPSRGRSRRVNGALIGGAISAGVSLASIAAGALVARRRGRSDARWERVG
jgi:hypothetical protein